MLRDIIYYFRLFKTTENCYLYTCFIQFAEKSSYHHIFFNGDNQKNEELRNLYKNILIYSFLTNVISKSLYLEKSAKKTNLITDHAIQKKTETKKLIQKYINNGHRSTLFPMHRNQAIDYFDVRCLSDI